MLLLINYYLHLSRNRFNNMAMEKKPFIFGVAASGNNFTDREK